MNTRIQKAFHGAGLFLALFLFSAASHSTVVATEYYYFTGPNGNEAPEACNAAADIYMGCDTGGGTTTYKYYYSRTYLGDDVGNATSCASAHECIMHRYYQVAGDDCANAPGGRTSRDTSGLYDECVAPIQSCPAGEEVPYINEVCQISGSMAVCPSDSTGIISVGGCDVGNLTSDPVGPNGESCIIDTDGTVLCFKSGEMTGDVSPGHTGDTSSPPTESPEIKVEDGSTSEGDTETVTETTVQKKENGDTVTKTTTTTTNTTTGETQTTTETVTVKDSGLTTNSTTKEVCSGGTCETTLTASSSGSKTGDGGSGGVTGVGDGDGEENLDLSEIITEMPENDIAGDMDTAAEDGFTELNTDFDGALSDLDQSGIGNYESDFQWFNNIFPSVTCSDFTFTVPGTSHSWSITCAATAPFRALIMFLLSVYTMYLMFDLFVRKPA